VSDAEAERAGGGSFKDGDVEAEAGNGDAAEECALLGRGLIEGGRDEGLAKGDVGGLLVEICREQGECDIEEG
jgi:hypothetical protein